MTKDTKFTILCYSVITLVGTVLYMLLDPWMMTEGFTFGFTMIIIAMIGIGTTYEGY